MKTVIKNATIINENNRFEGDLLIDKDRISKIGGEISTENSNIIEASGYYLIPGIIDDQVHFREPGFTYKADILSESIAAVAGGVTSFMEMPNTKPQSLTQELLEQKYSIAAGRSPANYSFFMGASNDNLEEVLKTNHKDVCGIKIFMGSSTGDMLVDEEAVLRAIFGNANLLIATHCEDESRVRSRMSEFKEKYGDKVNASFHPLIRDHEACFLSSSKAIRIAKETDARLHILHISTKEELDLFDNSLPLRDKRITAEACVHHLYFSDDDYELLGNKLKCNPAVKTFDDRAAIRKALLDNRIDIVATDHAPHTRLEKSSHYWEAPSGLPLVQHGLLMMLDLVGQNVLSMERLVEKMCHAPADCFRLYERGFLREGYKADLVLLDPNFSTEIKPTNVHYKCAWSPIMGRTLPGQIKFTFVNGVIVYDNGFVKAKGIGERLRFERD